MANLRAIVFQLSSIFATLVFLLMLFVGIDFFEPLSLDTIIPSTIRAGLVAFLFWISGLVAGDVIIKGIVDDINIDSLDPLEGGLEQRLYGEKQGKEVLIVSRDIEMRKSK